MFRVSWGVGCWILMAGAVCAQDIRIVKPGAEKTAIDLSALRADGVEGANLAAVLRNDLVRSGWFTVVDGAAVRVAGSCGAQGGRALADVQVVNTGDGAKYLSDRFAEDVRAWRRVAHRAADAIVKAVTGETGIAATRIAAVGSINGRKNLYLFDADGEGSRQITRDDAPCLTPAWTPDGVSIFYMSFHGGYPDIYRIDLAAQRRETVCRYPGINAGPDISPDGRRMAMTLSRDGNPELYTMDLGGNRPRRQTETRRASEASPSWSPDGRELAYVADGTGAPQIYIRPYTGGSPKLLTHRGTENVTPDWGPDGRIAYTSRRGGRYHICVIDPRTGDDVQLTSGGVDYEEPSWAPDGRHIICVKTVAYRMNLYILDTLGDPEVAFSSLPGDWYSPAWSPE